MMTPSERIAAYTQLTGQYLAGYLGPGPGQDGFVMESSKMTAVKFFDRKQRFTREAEVYSVLRTKGIQIIEGHNIPRLLNIVPNLAVLEISVVDRPFILDFAGAKLPHEVPDFDEEIMAEHHEHLRELFGDRWADAMHVAEMFRLATGFTLLDIHPGNIAFADTE
jgi:hypothetical protein